jgi:hypothetical protein
MGRPERRSVVIMAKEPKKRGRGRPKGSKTIRRKSMAERIHRELGKSIFSVLKKGRTAVNGNGEVVNVSPTAADHQAAAKYLCMRPNPNASAPFEDAGIDGHELMVRDANRRIEAGLLKVPNVEDEGEAEA